MNENNVLILKGRIPTDKEHLGIYDTMYSIFSVELFLSKIFVKFFTVLSIISVLLLFLINVSILKIVFALFLCFFIFQIVRSYLKNITIINDLIFFYNKEYRVVDSTITKFEVIKNTKGVCRLSLTTSEGERVEGIEELTNEYFAFGKETLLVFAPSNKLPSHNNFIKVFSKEMLENLTTELLQLKDNSENEDIIEENTKEESTVNENSINEKVGE